MKEVDSTDVTDLREEVVQIKKLLILQLVASGLSQATIAAVLGVNQATVSRLLNSTSIPKRPQGQLTGHLPINCLQI